MCCVLRPELSDLKGEESPWKPTKAEQKNSKSKMYFLSSKGDYSPKTIMLQ